MNPASTWSWYDFRPAKKREKRCARCGREFEDLSWAATAKFCNNKCAVTAKTKRRESAAAVGRRKAKREIRA